MRKRIFEIIEVAKEHDKMSHLYDLFMNALIIVSHYYTVNVFWI